MDAIPTYNSPVEGRDDRDDRVEEEGASGDHDKGTNGGVKSGECTKYKTSKKNRSTKSNKEKKLISEKIMNSNITKVTILMVKRDLFGMQLE